MPSLLLRTTEEKRRFRSGAEVQMNLATGTSPFLFLVFLYCTNPSWDRPTEASRYFFSFYLYVYDLCSPLLPFVLLSPGEACPKMFGVSFFPFLSFWSSGRRSFPICSPTEWMIERQMQRGSSEREKTA